MSGVKVNDVGWSLTVTVTHIHIFLKVKLKATSSPALLCRSTSFKGLGCISMPVLQLLPLTCSAYPFLRPFPIGQPCVWHAAIDEFLPYCADRPCGLHMERRNRSGGVTHGGLFTDFGGLVSLVILTATGSSRCFLSLVTHISTLKELCQSNIALISTIRMTITVTAALFGSPSAC